ncbi:mandelate racemase/muconate lactonizing enzyme family protein [Nitrospira sp. BLG_1]|uniref:mandelate racemase/muconate lactonizing enzyme family protein n=1 Tax=Nitrospira sp. BLG_1 TaxID=3395883 RepID=UPI0039BCBE35
MAIKRLDVQSLNIPFKQAFVHASAVRAMTEAVLVTVTNGDGIAGIGEGCPRRYVTGETIDSIRDFIETHCEQCMTFRSVQDVKQWVAEHVSIIDQNPAAWCAVENACLDLFGKEAGLPIETLLGLPSLNGRFQYSAVLGTDNLQSFEKQLQRYRSVGFTDFKVKVTGRLQDDIDKLGRLHSFKDSKLRVRLDANNLWGDAERAWSYLKQLPGRITAIEEPLKVGDYDGCRWLAREMKVPIILDESFLRVDQFALIQSDPPSTWIINIRVSKMGGILRALAVAKRAKEIGIPVIIGAQVGETSILTRAALTIANSYRGIVIAQEGAFGTLLLERDICDPPLMFGAAGRLDTTALSGAGLGLIRL